MTKLALYPSAANPQSLLIGPGPYFFGTEFRQKVARMNAATGTLDPAFAVASPTVTIGGSSARILALPDGRLLIPGLHEATTASLYNGMLRLLADGTVDTAFQAGPTVSHFDPNVAVAFSTAESLPNGSIVAGPLKSLPMCERRTNPSAN